MRGACLGRIGGRSCLKTAKPGERIRPLFFRGGQGSPRRRTELVSDFFLLSQLMLVYFVLYSSYGNSKSWVETLNLSSDIINKVAMGEVEVETQIDGGIRCRLSTTCPPHATVMITIEAMVNKM